MSLSYSRPFGLVPFVAVCTFGLTMVAVASTVSVSGPPEPLAQARGAFSLTSPMVTFDGYAVNETFVDALTGGEELLGWTYCRDESGAAINGCLVTSTRLDDGRYSVKTIDDDTPMNRLAGFRYNGYRKLAEYLMDEPVATTDPTSDDVSASWTFELWEFTRRADHTGRVGNTWVMAADGQVDIDIGPSHVDRSVWVWDEHGALIADAGYFMIADSGEALFTSGEAGCFEKALTYGAAVEQSYKDVADAFLWAEVGALTLAPLLDAPVSRKVQGLLVASQGPKRALFHEFYAPLVGSGAAKAATAVCSLKYLDVDILLDSLDDMELPYDDMDDCWRMYSYWVEYWSTVETDGGAEMTVTSEKVEVMVNVCAESID